MYRDYISKIKKVYPVRDRLPAATVSYNGGFSTLEILIAMAILAICLTAVILVLFGSQSMMVDSQINSEALTKAQELLEKEQALARKDFKLVNPIAPVTDGIYQKKIDVYGSANPSDFFTKKITATVSWTGEYNRQLSVQLSALVTDFENAVGGDTCSSVLTGDWTNPNPPVSIFVGNINSASLYPAISVDAYKQKLYVAISDAVDPDFPTLFVYDITNPSAPFLLSSIDNDTGIGITAGINAIHATDKYLFAAKATGPGSGQLQVFDITGLTPPVNFEVLGVTGTGDQAIGNSIFYKDGYIYLGLTTTGSGPEFHIIDAHDPTTLGLSEVGSWPPAGGSLSNNINDIYVKGRYVYLAHPTDISSPYVEEITVLDISNPTNPQRVGGYNAPDDDGYGKSIYSVGDTLYLGRIVTAGNPEFYILDSSNLSGISEIASQEISEDVNGLLVRDYLAFLITNNQFQIWRIDNPSSISNYYSVSFAGGTSLDCEGNYLYASSIDSSYNGYLSVISAP